MFVKDHPFLRAEFDWIAVDAEGFVGFFATAGAGPIPETVLRDAVELDDLYSEVKGLPDMGEPIPASPFDRDVTEWLLVARKGLYAFDWRRESSAYELVARPGRPVAINDLADAKLQRLARSTELGLKFNEANRLTSD